MSLNDFLELLKVVVKDYGSFILGAIGIVITLVYGGKWYQRLIRQRVEHLEEQVDAARAKIHECQTELETQGGRLAVSESERNSLKAKLARIKLAFAGSDDQNIWLGGPIIKPADYHGRMESSIPILLVANLKGGVGKSTIAANLVPYFELTHSERVLAIDLDYQGSLSSMLLPEPYNRQARHAQSVRDLIEGQINRLSALGMSLRPVRNSSKDSRIVDCDDPFANFETRLLIQWLGGEIDGDIRYNLAHMLHDPVIQKSFDRIIIDAPPRITTGFINALCASTHLVVPFVLDALSAERVGLFLGQLQRMRPQLFPHLSLAGVVGTMKRTDTEQIGNAEAAAFNEAKSRVQKTWGSSEYVLVQAPIPRKQDIADAAGLRIAYHESVEAKRIFSRLGSELYKRAPGRLNASRVATEAAE